MILKNGKRIDGCTDTLPVGTVQPFLGLTPPLGYLVCQGQMVSKAEYPELYKVCLSAFGIETNTHFYLPDLRGKTLAGYDENDATMNTIGKLLGQKTHVHTTGNHTLTVAEMPTHQHRTQFAWIDSTASGSEWGYVVKMDRDGKTDGGAEEFIGGSQPHNHGDTGVASNYQPTITVNWIVKAAMLIPHYFTVENSLTSTSTSNALSAAQGKILNGKFANYLPLNGGTMTGEISIGQGDYKGIQIGENGRINATLNGNTNCTILGMMDGTVIVGHGDAPLVFRGSYGVPSYNGVALIETGSNSNGTWIKFVDGTMICRHTKGVSIECTSQWGNLYEGGADLGSFPASFSGVPTVMVTNTAPDGYFEGLRSSSATSWGHIRMAIPSSATREFVVNLLAIGRWK
jgi:microcystin-dependent protein